MLAQITLPEIRLGQGTFSYISVHIFQILCSVPVYGLYINDVQHDFGKKFTTTPCCHINHISLTNATGTHVNHDHAVVQLSPNMCDLNPRAYTGQNYETCVWKQHRRCELHGINKR